MTKPENKKTTHDDKLWWSQNNGKNIRYRKRLQNEREAKEMYEDGLKELDSLDSLPDPMDE
jgi:hypothetical protein